MKKNELEIYKGSKQSNSTKNVLSNLAFVKETTSNLYKNLNLSVCTLLGTTYCKSGLASPLMNGTVGCNTDDCHVDEVVEKVFQYFQDNKLPHSWWTETLTEPLKLKFSLEKRGLSLIGEFPGMLLLMGEITPPKQNVIGLNIQTISENKDLKSWSEVICKVFEFPKSEASKYSDLFQHQGFQGPFFHLMGIKDSKTVCTGSVLCTNQGAYLYNIATLVEEQGQGYATHLCYKLLQIASEQGCKRVGLVSSPQAASIYGNLGFKIVCQHRIYL